VSTKRFIRNDDIAQTERLMNLYYVIIKT